MSKPPVWPVLVIEQDDFPPIGIPKLELDGKPLELLTVDNWELSFGKEDVATLTVRIPVRVRVVEPAS